MKDLKFIQACPDDTYYTWQVHTWLESLRNIGKSDKAISLIFTPTDRKFNEKWKELEALYPESEFYYVKDEDNVTKLLGIYIPILRPHILWQHFEKHPELQEKTIIYTDCDILWLDTLNISHLLEDDVNYVSDANSYLNYSYFY